MTSDFPIPPWGRAQTLAGGPADNGKLEGEMGGHTVDTALETLCSHRQSSCRRWGLHVCPPPGAREPCRQTPGTRRVQAPCRECPPASPPPETEEEAPRLALPAAHPWASLGVTAVCPAWAARPAPYKTCRRHRPTPRGSPSSQTHQRLPQQTLVRLVRNLPGGPLRVLSTNSARRLKRNPTPTPSSLSAPS